jgi:hypothetical protein
MITDTERKDIILGYERRIDNYTIETLLRRIDLYAKACKDVIEIDNLQGALPGLKTIKTYYMDLYKSKRARLQKQGLFKSEYDHNYASAVKGELEISGIN